MRIPGYEKLYMVLWLDQIQIRIDFFEEWSIRKVYGLTQGWQTLLPRLFCSLEHFASKRLGTLHSGCIINPIRYTLHPNTLCSATHFAPRNTLLPGTPDVEEEKIKKEQSVLGNKVFHGTECFRKQSVLGSKVVQGAECSRQQTVLRSKTLQRAKCVQD